MATRRAIRVPEASSREANATTSGAAKTNAHLATENTALRVESVVDAFLAEGKTETFAQKMVRAQQLRDDLNNSTDKLNSVLGAAQVALVGLDLGVRAFVEIGDNDEYPGIQESIGLTKLSGRWLLVYCFSADGQEEFTPILQTSKTIRFEAAQAIPRLLDELIQVAEDQLMTVDNLNDELSAFVAQVTK